MVYLQSSIMVTKTNCAKSEYLKTQDKMDPEVWPLTEEL